MMNHKESQEVEQVLVARHNLHACTSLAGAADDDVGMACQSGWHSATSRSLWPTQRLM